MATKSGNSAISSSSTPSLSHHDGNVVEMGGTTSGAGGAGGDRRMHAAEQLRILKERQLGKKNPGYVVKSKKATLPVIVPSRLGDLASIAPRKAFVAPVSSQEASRILVSSLLEGEEGGYTVSNGVSSPGSSVATSASSKARGNNNRGFASGGGGSTSSSNRFALFEDHSRTGTPGISLKPATISWSSLKK